MMKTSIATVSISGTYEEKVKAIAAAGFDGIEIFENDLLAYPGTPREAAALARDAGLEITLFQPFRDFEGLPEPRRSQAFDRAKHKFDLMAELGTDLVLVCSSCAPDGLGGIDRAAADFRELGEIARERNIRVGFEALAWGRHISDHRDAWEVVRRADHPNIGLILDSFHTLARGIDVNSIRSIPGDRIFIVQLADAPSFAMDTLYWSRHFRNMPGQGELPVVDFMAAVAATGYDGYLSLEIFNDQFRGSSPEATALDGHRSLIYLKDRVGREHPELKIPAAPDAGPVVAEAVSFVEFAADADGRGTLRQNLQNLGFAKAGTHISKDVELWRQGEINLVINADPNGNARKVFDKNGVAVCDIGLKVQDAGVTVRHARHLLADPFMQPVGPGELDIPAIKGVGGSVLHFLDDALTAKVWGLEFGVPTDLAPATGVGLTKVDHIAQTMPYEEILTWKLFYRSIFGMEPAPMVDVIDPAGLVHSQAVHTADRGIAFTLNGAADRRTFAGAFAGRSGPAVQHIAFATNDILVTARALEKCGFRGLEMPGNYFNDLEARFGLEPALLAELRHYNILYDRDQSGEFFQLYGCAWETGFFFEVVERRGGYDGYGAPNAIFRIAAQKRQFRK